jgi:hypothetical protein
MMKQPRARDVGVQVGREDVPVTRDYAKSEPSDAAAFAPERANLGRWQRASAALRVNRSAPKNFVGHPVADARKELLHVEEGFEWGAGAPGADISKFFLTEFWGVEGRREGAGCGAIERIICKLN